MNSLPLAVSIKFISIFPEIKKLFRMRNKNQLKDEVSARVFGKVLAAKGVLIRDC